MADPKPISEGELRERLDFDDAALFDECAAEFHRVKGPGGQHRNKVASAVRLTHRPSGYVVNATERRSQHENRANALQRLREAIALGARRPVPQEIIWPEGVQIRDRRLRVSPRNPAYWRVIALVLDALVGEEGQVSKAAERLGVSTSSMTRFLADHPKAWIEANRIREAYGLSPLRRS